MQGGSYTPDYLTSGGPGGGTAGQVLTSNGPGAAPTYQNAGAGSGPTCLKDFYTDAGNVGAGETDLYSFTTIANQLSAAGQKLTATYGGLCTVAATSLPVIQVYFAGTSIFTNASIVSAISNNYSLAVIIIRTGASTARSIVTYADNQGATDVQETDLTSLTFSGTNIIKITGQDTGGVPVSNTTVAKLGTISWVPAGP